MKDDDAQMMLLTGVVVAIGYILLATFVVDGPQAGDRPDTIVQRDAIAAFDDLTQLTRQLIADGTTEAEINATLAYVPPLMASSGYVVSFTDAQCSAGTFSVTVRLATPGTSLAAMVEESGC